MWCCDSSRNPQASVKIPPVRPFIVCAVCFHQAKANYGPTGVNFEPLRDHDHNEEVIEVLCPDLELKITKKGEKVTLTI